MTLIKLKMLVEKLRENSDEAHSPLLPIRPVRKAHLPKVLPPVSPPPVDPITGMHEY